MKRGKREVELFAARDVVDADSMYDVAKKLPLRPRVFWRGVGSFEVSGRIVERLDEKGRRGGTLFRSRLVGLG